MPIAGAAHADTMCFFTSDVYQIDEDGRRNRGQYVVFDLYVTFQEANPDLKLLSVFGMEISANADFFHSDAYGGNWQASYSDPAFGGKPWMDSFVTMGPAVADTPFNASVDLNFSANVASTISSDAGWYNADPFNGQGLVDENYQVMIARLVLDSEAVLANDNTGFATVNVSGDIAFNYNEPGVFFDNDYQTFSIVVPGPGGLVAIAGIGLCSVRRRRD
ncbi:MAG: hypothetical protein MK085_08360 [Phycisphaerales bacterium]|nr:hypothetical protein [Phycisphaerales bacterium]